MFEKVQDTCTHCLSLTGPVDPMGQIGNRCEDIEALAACWGPRGISPSGRVQIERQISRQTATIKNFMNEFAIVLRHENRVMAQLRILALQSQIEQKATHGVAILLETLRKEARTHFC